MFALPISMLRFESITVICIKIAQKFICHNKKVKIFQRWELLSQTPLPLAAGGLKPPDPQNSPHYEFLATRLTCTVL